MSWSLYFRSRMWVSTVVACVAFELLLTAWGGAAFQVRRGLDFYDAVAVDVPMQIVPVMLLLYSLDSDHQQLELGAARSLVLMKLVTVLGGAAIVAIAALAPSYAHAESNTLHPLSSLAAFVGMYGIGLVAACLVDRRLAGIPAFIPVLAPLTFDPSRIPGHEWWSFVIPGDQSRQFNMAALLWGAVGVLLMMLLGPRVPLLKRRT